MTPVLQIMEYVLSIAAIARAWSSYLATLCSKVCHTFYALTYMSQCKHKKGMQLAGLVRNNVCSPLVCVLTYVVL